VRGRGAAEPPARDPGARHLRETLSVYGTEPVFVDGDDTPWSKAFLASAYASRGREGQVHERRRLEALMGTRRGTRCSTSRRAASRRSAPPARRACRTGRSRAWRSCCRCREGARDPAENVLAAWLDLEVASGNDAIASHSEIRKTAKLMGQFLPGTDFVTSGYSVDAARGQHLRRRQLRRRRPRGVDDVQRDWQVDAGSSRLPEDDAAGGSARRPARAGCKPCFAGAGLPAVTDARWRAPTDGCTRAGFCGPDRASGRRRRRSRGWTDRLGGRTSSAA
jgi:propanediol dehydratase large subunit